MNLNLRTTETKSINAAIHARATIATSCILVFELIKILLVLFADLILEKRSKEIFLLPHYSDLIQTLFLLKG